MFLACGGGVNRKQCGEEKKESNNCGLVLQTKQRPPCRTFSMEIFLDNMLFVGFVHAMLQHFIPATNVMKSTAAFLRSYYSKSFEMMTRKLKWDDDDGNCTLWWYSLDFVLVAHTWHNSWLIQLMLFVLPVPFVLLYCGPSSNKEVQSLFNASSFSWEF